MELRARVRAVLSVVVAAVVVAPASAAAQDLKLPASKTEPPPSFQRTAAEVERIAARAELVRDRSERLDPTAYTRGAGRWQVAFFARGEELVQVHVDDASGRIVEQWAGDQVRWRMARGYSGAFGRKLNAPYVWIPLSLLFLLPFVDLRRPLRLLHLDLVVLLCFGLSHVFFNRGEIGVSAPLVYPVLAYLLVRMLFVGVRGRQARGPLVPHVPLAWLAMALVLIVALRVTLNVFDSNVIDVGYAGVIGADRIADGDGLYGEGFSEDVPQGDTYGPVNYLLYLPFEQGLRWSGAWDELPAAHGAAILFDLLAIGGLLMVGRALRPGRAGRALGLALAYAWAAYPYTAFVLETNANDTLVALACIGALWGVARGSSGLSGVAVGLGAAAKFAPIALLPLFARRSGRPLVFGLALLVTLLVAVLPFLPDGGPREIYDRTLGYQAGRDSPFSIWGQVEGLGGVHTAVKAGAAALALVVALVPRRPSVRQVAALGAAAVIAVQLTTTHWFYLYVVWFLPFVLVAFFGGYETAFGGARERPVLRRQQQLLDGHRASL